MTEVAGWYKAVEKSGEVASPKLVVEGHLSGSSAKTRTVRAIPFRRVLCSLEEENGKTGRLYSEAFLLAKTRPEPNPSVAKKPCHAREPPTHPPHSICVHDLLLRASSLQTQNPTVSMYLVGPMQPRRFVGGGFKCIKHHTDLTSRNACFLSKKYSMFSVFLLHYHRHPAERQVTEAL
jgi:hypothetical protein